MERHVLQGTVNETWAGDVLLLTLKHKSWEKKLNVYKEMDSELN